MKKFSKFLAPILAILLGVLLVAKQGELVSIALTVLGVVFIVFGIIDIVKKNDVRTGVVRIVVGAVIIAFGWLLLPIALYIIAVCMTIAGIAGIYALLKGKKKFSMDYLQPILMTVAGICLFFNQGAAISWVFIVVGIMLIIHGALGLMNAINK